MKSLLEQLKDYFANTPREVIEAEWAKLSCYDDVGPTVDEFLADWSFTCSWTNSNETLKFQETPDYSPEFLIFA